MTYFNRAHPLQSFTNTNPAGSAVVPLNGRTFSGSATASVVFVATATGASTRTASASTSVVFTATATGSTTRTASVTTSATFTATNTGIQLFTSSVASAPLESIVGGNVLGVGQSIHRSSAGSW